MVEDRFLLGYHLIQRGSSQDLTFSHAHTQMHTSHTHTRTSHTHTNTHLTHAQTLLSPVSSPYQKLAEECVKYGVGVELFLLPTNYADVATLGHFVSSTGGELHYYKHFQVRGRGGAGG